jgi:hypothetical protein
MKDLEFVIYRSKSYFKRFTELVGEIIKNNLSKIKNSRLEHFLFKKKELEQNEKNVNLKRNIPLYFDHRFEFSSSYIFMQELCYVDTQFS